jgi:hypothetical protein
VAGQLGHEQLPAVVADLRQLLAELRQLVGERRRLAGAGAGKGRHPSKIEWLLTTCVGLGPSDEGPRIASVPSWNGHAYGPHRLSIAAFAAVTVVKSAVTPADYRPHLGSA